MLFAAGWLTALSWYRSSLVKEASRADWDQIRSVHAELAHQTVFPPIVQPGIFPAGLQRYRVLSPGRNVVFDSKITGDHSNSETSASAELPAWLKTDRALERGEPVSYQRGDSIELLIPIAKSGAGAILYSFDASGIVLRLALGILAGLLLATGFALLPMGVDPRAMFKLRAKFVAAIVLINLITAGIIFWSLSSLQIHEQTGRIEKQSLIYSRFSTERIIRAFLDSFDKAYFERFLPEVRTIIASNDDLVRIRILSLKGDNILFDSEQALSRADEADASPASAGVRKAEFPAEFEEQLSASDLASRTDVHEDGSRWFSVVGTFRSPAQEPLFRVEFLYSFRSIYKSLASIRENIVLDLGPALAVSTLIALLLPSF